MTFTVAIIVCRSINKRSHEPIKKKLYKKFSKNIKNLLVTTFVITKVKRVITIEGSIEKSQILL